MALNTGFHRLPRALVNELVTLILDEDVKSRTSRASGTTRFLETETKRRQRELAKIEAEISDFKLKNEEALPEKQQFLLSKLENAKSRHEALARSILVIGEQKRLSELELNIRKAAKPKESIAETPQSALGRQIQALREELGRKKILYKDSHPDVQALAQQLRALEEAQANKKPEPKPVKAESPPDASLEAGSIEVMMLKEKITNLEGRRELLTKRREELATSIAEIDALIVRIPEVQVTLTNLERQREVVQRGLEELTSKFNDARLGERLEKDRQAERFQVIEQPVVPSEPVRPNRPLILAGGVGISGGLALAIVVLLELLNRTVRSSSDVMRAIGEPPFGTIPYFKTYSEQRSNRRRVIIFVLLLVALAAIALAAIHFFYLPLDEVMFKVQRRFGLL